MLFSESKYQLDRRTRFLVPFFKLGRFLGMPLYAPVNDNDYAVVGLASILLGKDFYSLWYFIGFQSILDDRYKVFFQAQVPHDRL